MSPEEFKKAIEIAIRSVEENPLQDEETLHCTTDELMEILLDSLGYGEGVALIRDTTRWYS